MRKEKYYQRSKNKAQREGKRNLSFLSWSDSTRGGDSCFNHGFTLVEVMIAMMVLLLGMLGVMSMQYYAINGNAFSRELRSASNLSSEVVEQLRSTPYTDLASDSDDPPVNVHLSGNVEFSRVWFVMPNCLIMAFDPDNRTCVGLVPACKDKPATVSAVPVSAVSARTCWSDREGVDHSVTISSIRWDENETYF